MWLLVKTAYGADCGISDEREGAIAAVEASAGRHGNGGDRVPATISGDGSGRKDLLAAICRAPNGLCCEFSRCGARRVILFRPTVTSTVVYKTNAFVVLRVSERLWFFFFTFSTLKFCNVAAYNYVVWIKFANLIKLFFLFLFRINENFILFFLRR